MIEVDSFEVFIIHQALMFILITLDIINDSTMKERQSSIFLVMLDNL